MNNENDTKLDTIKTGEAFKKLSDEIEKAVDALSKIAENSERIAKELTKEIDAQEP